MICTDPQTCCPPVDADRRRAATGGGVVRMGPRRHHLTGVSPSTRYAPPHWASWSDRTPEGRITAGQSVKRWGSASELHRCAARALASSPPILFFQRIVHAWLYMTRRSSRVHRQQPGGGVTPSGPWERRSWLRRRIPPSGKKDQGPWVARNVKRRAPPSAVRPQQPTRTPFAANAANPVHLQ